LQVSELAVLPAQASNVAREVRVDDVVSGESSMHADAPAADVDAHFLPPWQPGCSNK